MVELISDCLYHIFGFLTPVEWIRLSQVCRLWKTVALKHWKRITEIHLMDKYDGERKPSVITVEEAEKIVLCVAPYIQTLKVFASSRYFETSNIFSRFNHYEYKVNAFNHRKLYSLLAENATKITEIEFGSSQNVEYLQRLFKTNNIKKVIFKENYNFFRNIPTDDIEDLQLKLNEAKDTSTFKGCFKNLKKLTLSIDCFWNVGPPQTLTKILPHVLGLKSFKLFINYHRYEHRPKAYQVLSREIVKFSQLEELSIISGDIEIPSVGTFIENLSTSCLKLRSIRIQSFEMDDNALHNLLTLPNLENLDAQRLSGFCSPGLPQMTNLTDCCVGFYQNHTVDIKSLCSAVKNMPKLLKLEVYGLTNEQTLTLAYEVIVAATSQEKNVLVKKLDHDCGYRKLKIQRKKIGGAEESSDEQSVTLDMLIANYNNDKYFQSLQTFIEENLYSYEASAFDLHLKGQKRKLYVL